MHAGNIEHSNPLQRRVAEVQDDAITLRVKIQINPSVKKITYHTVYICNCSLTHLQYVR